MDSTSYDLIGAALNLGPLANNGGTTLTHRPGNNSPLIDRGMNPAGLGFHQRGVGRGSGLAADIGAVEVPSWVVRNTNDSWPNSLRQMMLDAKIEAGANTITFDPAYFGQPRIITLTTGQLSTLGSLTINGPGASLLTIDGNQASTVFYLIGLDSDSSALT